MLLGMKYYEEIIKKANINKSVINTIIKKESKYNINCNEWSTQQVEDFLRDLKYENPNSISRAFRHLQKISKVICDGENLTTPEWKFPHGHLIELINYDKLLKTVISEEEYRIIQKQLHKNVRDRLIFELAWLGLNNNEIRNLKEENVKFLTLNDSESKEVVELYISPSKSYRVKEPDVIEDIKKCHSNHPLFENEYIIGSRKVNHHHFKQSNYLIKPSHVGIQKDTPGNPDIHLDNAFDALKVNCPGIDINQLSIQNIRRSKIVLLLTQQTKDFVKNKFNLNGSDSSLYFYERIARLKYPNSINQDSSKLPINKGKTDKEKLLTEIKKIQGSLDASKSESERINRSQKLSRKLKQLYDYRCQLCDIEDGIPLIEKEDGTYYVELHHIKQIATKILNDEEDYLDTYSNVIVVCPFHHKVLHYHHGGFFDLLKDEEGLYFRSKRGSLIRVITDNHLNTKL